LFGLRLANGKRNLGFFFFFFFFFFFKKKKFYKKIINWERNALDGIGGATIYIISFICSFGVLLLYIIFGGGKGVGRWSVDRYR
jgi:hypothetical protein